MSRWLLALIACVLLMPIAGAQEKPAEDIQRQIEEARRQIDEAARTLAELYREKYASETGKKRAMLGILLPDHTNPDGVEIVGVTPSGGAEAAGLQAGDLIVKMDELVLSETDNPMRALSRYMRNVEPGDEIEVVYERDGKQQTATITTQARSKHMLSMVEEKLEHLDIDIDLDTILPEVSQEVWQQPGISSRRLLAVEGDLADYFDVEQGVVLIDPPQDSELKAGDVLLAVGEVEVKDLDSARRSLNELKGDTEIQVQRHGKRAKLDVSADEFAGMNTGMRVIRIKRPQGDKDDEVMIRVEVVD